MKILKENTTYKNAEIADWFNIKLSTLRTGKQKYLDLLSEYCTFDSSKTGYITILTLHNKELNYYEKQRSKIYNYVKDNYLSYWKSPVDTVSRVAAELYIKQPKNLEASFKTIEHYLGEIKNKEYGVADTFTAGTKGISTRVWSKIIGQIGKNVSFELKAQRRYVELTPEEIALVRKRFNEWYLSTDIAAIEIKQDVMENNLTKEQAWEAFEKKIGLSDASYTNFIARVSDEIKCNWLTRAQKLENAQPLN